MDSMGEGASVYILHDTQCWGQAVHMKHLILRRNGTQKLFSTIEGENRLFSYLPKKETS